MNLLKHASADSDDHICNEPDMEDALNFKTLFLRNLHPGVSQHLGVLRMSTNNEWLAVARLGAESLQQTKDGQDKDFNDQTDALTKVGALPPNPSVAAITRCQHATGVHSPPSSHITLSPQFSADDLLTLQTADPTLRTMANHISDPLIHPISTSELRIFFSVKHMVHLKDGVLTYVPKPLTAPKLVVPQGQRGMILTQRPRCTMHRTPRCQGQLWREVWR